LAVTVGPFQDRLAPSPRHPMVAHGGCGTWRQ
jgi:hypothetical protein